MNMKQHILAALQEEFDSWEELLKGMNEDQLTTPLLPSNWSAKDVITHLWAWQQRSVARVQAAQLDREPDFPEWAIELDPESDADTEDVNAWIYEAHREQPWSTVHQSWREGFLRFLELGEAISERDLLDSARYLWLEGYPLAFIFLASYDHHQEHLEKLQAWISQHANKNGEQAKVV